MLLLGHAGDVVGPGGQLLRQAVAGEHHLQPRRAVIQEGAQRLQGEEAADGVDHLIQHQQAGLPRLGQLHGLLEEGGALGRGGGLLRLIHLEGELVDALAAQDGELGKALRRRHLAAGAALEELGDHRPLPPARAPEGQTEGRRGLALAVAVVDVYQTLLLCHKTASILIG